MDRAKSHSYQNYVEEIRNRLDGRPYRLGLDMGVGSIGVGIVALEPDKDGDLCPSDLVFASSRVFPSSEGAQERRQKRGQRNAIRHKAHRLEKLWKLLGSRGLMLPFAKDVSTDPLRLRFSETELRKDVYQLRLSGLSERLSLPELGMVLYHIAGHRGASSVRSLFSEKDEADKDEGERLALTKQTAETEHLDTFIEVLYSSKEKHKTNFRNKLGYSEKTPLPTRDIIEKELNRLLATQKEFYPEILDEAYIKEIKDCILFENEKLVPEAGNCPYFPQEQKLPKAAFINEERRLWEAVNNVRVVVEESRGNRFVECRKSLSQEEKEKLFDELRSGKDISAAGFRNLFPEYSKCKEVILQGVTKKTQKIQGFRFRDLEDRPWFARLAENDRLEYLSLYVNCPDDRKLQILLKERFGFSDSESADASTIDSIIDGYAPVGLSAMKVILGYIKEYGLSYQEAEIKAVEDGALGDHADNDIVYDYLPYYGMVIPASTQALMGKAWHHAFEERRQGKGFTMPCTNKDEAMYGRIANPVVHQALNELRKVMNEIIDIFGRKPESICVEVARDLKVGMEAREQMSKDNSKKEKENKRIFEKYCKPNGLGKKFIKTFKLLQEQKFKCPYCLRTISVSDVTSHNVDIDHILPVDDTGDSSFDNLVVAHKTCNETKKAKRIPYVAFSSDVKLWGQIEQYIDEVGFSERKKRNFQMTEEHYREYLDNNSFSPRFAPDNAYIARVTCRYLQSLYMPDDRLRAVRTIRGSETAILRRAWHLNGISNSLAEALGVDSESEYVDKKNRTDHRHHALDALVAALFTQKYSTIIETFISQGHSPKEVMERLPIPPFFRLDGGLSRQEQVEQFRKTVESFIIGKTFVSRKLTINRNGKIFNDSQYSVLAEGPEDVILCKKMPVDGIGVDHVAGTNAKTLEGLLEKKFNMPAFVDEEAKVKVQKKLDYNALIFNKITACLPEAEKALEEANAASKSKGTSERPITEKSKIDWACKKVGGFYYQISNSKKNKVFLNRLTSSAFDTGENFSLDLYLDSDGKIKGEVVRKINAIQKNFIPEYKRNGYDLLERLYPKDVLEIDLVPRTGKGSKKELSQSIFIPNAPTARTYVLIETFTEVGKTVQVWFKPIVTTCDNVGSSFRVSGISKLNARKVVLSSLGLPVYRSRLLKEQQDVESD